MRVLERECDCGASFKQEIPDGPWGARLARFPASCEACAAEAERIDREQEAARELRERAEARARRERLCGIPAKQRAIGWTSIDSSGRPAEAAMSWARGELPALVLSGSVGVGKTYLAAAAAWTRLELAPLRWFTVPLLFARLGAGFGTGDRDDALRVLAGTCALVLDDLDKVRATEYAAEQLFVAIDGRAAAGAPLLVTTNLSLGQIAAKFPEPFGEAIASRLGDREYCAAVILEGEDRRLKRAG